VGDAFPGYPDAAVAVGGDGVNAVVEHVEVVGVE